MDQPVSRRDVLKLVAAQGLALVPASLAMAGPRHRRAGPTCSVHGTMTGAQALTETLRAEGTECVYGIPGAQENELWDTFKSKRLPYLLVTHEFSAASMADGYARSTGKPGVLCIVPGPGLTNSLSGLGEALLDSIPMVCVVGDVANGERDRAFQVHSLDHAAILRPVTKQTFQVQRAAEIPLAVRQAFQVARAGEPGPAAVVIPYNLLIESANYRSGPLEPTPLPLDEAAFRQALSLLQDRRLKVGIYAGLGCMDYSDNVARLATVLQAPVATSMSGKGVIPEDHPLAVGWGYGPQGTRTAEQVFRSVDLVLAVGVKYAEVSTGFYSQPQTARLIHVDINQDNLGKIMRTDVCVHADAGLFMALALEEADSIRRPRDNCLEQQIQARKREERQANNQMLACRGVDPMAFILALRASTEADALAFVDVTVSQYWATEVFTTTMPRTFFNPTNNQAMGWSIPAAIGAQKVHPGRKTLTVTGDGCFLMSAMEISTAVRENLPVKFFILDDQAYHYMQELQWPAYRRTTATVLARLDYQALAKGWGIAYEEIEDNDNLEPRLRTILGQEGPVLARVAIDYRRRPIRWISAARARYSQELSRQQKIRFLTRIGSRSVVRRPEND
jgi:acetolactate synthase-1/2/3 large subunit